MTTTHRRWLAVAGCGSPDADPGSGSTAVVETGNGTATNGSGATATLGTDESTTGTATAVARPSGGPSGNTADPAPSSTGGEDAASSTPPAGADSEDVWGGPTTTYTTESGVFTWTLPASWTAEQKEYNEDLLDYLGVAREEVLVQDPGRTVRFLATTGVGPSDNDGRKPEVVEVLDAEELPDVPVNAGEHAMGTGPVWFRAALLRAPDAADFPAFGGGEFLLSLRVVNMPEDVDPQATGDSFWSAWFYEQRPAAGFEYGTASLLSGTVTQDVAEEATGLRGEEAMRAVLATERYAALRAVMTSMDVRYP